MAEQEPNDLARRVEAIHNYLLRHQRELLETFELNPAHKGLLVDPENSFVPGKPEYAFNELDEGNTETQSRLKPTPRILTVEEVMTVFNQESPEGKYPTPDQARYLDGMTQQAVQTYSQLKSVLGLAGEMDRVPRDLQKVLDEKVADAKSRFEFLTIALFYITQLTGLVSEQAEAGSALALKFQHDYKVLWAAFIYFYNHAVQS